MSKKRRKIRHQRSSPAQTTAIQFISRKRRLPASRMPLTGRPLPPIQPYPSPSDNPYVVEIVRLIERVAASSKVNLFSILTDWIGMIEGSLRMWTDNMRTIALEGNLVDDPPEIKAIFARARERYLKASEQYPAVYRQMQEAFSATFALLMESAAPGLSWYGQQTDLNPDVIGQVFMTCLQPGPAWGQFFPPWELVLADARTTLPDGDELVYLELAQAALRARSDGHTLELEPGQNFPEWFSVVEAYYEPIIITDPIDSSIMMLALAAQFSNWIVTRNLVQFCWIGEIDPLLWKMAQINARLYGLNGYVLEHIEAWLDIQRHLKQQAEDPSTTSHPPEAIAPSLLYQTTGDEIVEANEPTSPLTNRSQPPDGPSFTSLFRQSKTNPD